VSVAYRSTYGWLLTLQFVSFHAHYDGRFTDHVLNYVEQKIALKNLLQTYLATFSDLGIETWLMHGTLLGWWWNQQILPWDSDVDVQVSEASMHYIAQYYNMSVFHYQTPRIVGGRDYMLEVNPHYKNREQTDKLNVIDARWIDTESGLFIDITTARYNLTHPDGVGMLSCKDGHEYLVRCVSHWEATSAQADALLGDIHLSLTKYYLRRSSCQNPASLPGYP
jgi:hypothetical protein